MHTSGVHARQDKTRQGKTRQGKARQGKRGTSKVNTIEYNIKYEALCVKPHARRGGRFEWRVGVPIGVLNDLVMISSLYYT